MVTGTDINAPTPLLDRVSSPDDLKAILRTRLHECLRNPGGPGTTGISGKQTARCPMTAPMEHAMWVSRFKLVGTR